METNWEFPEEISEFPNIVKSNMEEAAAKYCKSLPIPADPAINTYWEH